MRKRALWILFAAAVAVVGIVAYQRSSTPSRQAAGPGLERMVTTVRRATIARTISAAGRLAPLQEQSLLARSGGRVLEVTRQPGDAVAAGDLIVRLDATSAKLRALQAQRAYDQARLEATASVVEERRIELEAALRALEETELRAAFSGIVAEVGVEVGDEPGAQTVVARVIDVSRYTLTVDVDETDLPQVRPGQAVTVSVDSLPGVRLSGEVQRIGWLPSSSADVVVYPVEILLDPSDAPLRPGLSVEVEIVVNEARDVLALPVEALAVAGGGSFVSRIGPDGATEPVPVVTGLSDGRLIEIRSGLAEGDRVLANNFRLNEELNAAGRRAVVGGQPAGMVGGPPPGAVSGQPARVVVGGGR